MIQNLNFTHKGWFCGVVPIYLDYRDPECPLIAERHWCLLPLFIAVEFIWGACLFLRCMVDEEFEPGYPLMITGELL